jgi:hypothetical protein
VEAGGVEPPSRDISSKASTYIVALFHLTTFKAKQQAKMPPVCNFSTKRYQTLASAYPVRMTSFSPTPGTSVKDGPLYIRQPWRSYFRRLNSYFDRFLAGPTVIPGMPPGHLPIRSIPVAPSSLMKEIISYAIYTNKQHQSSFPPKKRPKILNPHLTTHANGQSPLPIISEFITTPSFKPGKLVTVPYFLLSLVFRFIFGVFF